jgi:hypothetical protein
MTAPIRRAVGVIALVTLAAACNRTDTTNTPVTTTSPAGTSTAPSSAAAKTRDHALVRFVDAAPSEARLDLFAGDLMLFEGVTFKTVTPYRAVDGQRYAFALRPAGMPQTVPLASNTEGLNDGSFYTAFAMPGDARDPQLRIVADHIDGAPDKKARVRLVHAGVGAGTVDVRAGGGAALLFDDVEYRAVSTYRDVAPIDGAVEIVGDGKAAVLASFRAHFEAGRYYTIVIVGSTRTTPRLEAFLIEDALSP